VSGPTDLTASIRFIDASSRRLLYCPFA